MALAPFTASNQYKIEKELSGSDFGSSVYLVQSLADPSFTCVVKKYNLQLIVSRLEMAADKEKYRSLVLEEAEKMRRLQHPHIVRVFSSFLEGHKFYLAVEYCDGPSLKETILRRQSEGKFFEEQKILTWTGQLILTLKFLHDRSILHRELTSENAFLVDNARIVKLGAFGIDNWFHHTFDCACVPPEILEGKPYGPESEVWALGVVVAELCSLQPGVTKSLEKVPLMLDRYSAQLRSLVINKLLEPNVAKRPSVSDIIRDPSLKATILDIVGDHNTVSTASSPGPDGNKEPCQNKPSRDVPIPEPFCDGQYYEKWDPFGKLIFEEAPSNVEAILAINNHNTDEASSIVIVCTEGEVITLQDTECDSSEWNNCFQQQIKIALPTDERIQHAAYDSENDYIYVKIMSKGKICGIGRQCLQSSADEAVPYGVVVSEAQADGRIFEGITVAAQRRLLYACDNRREITIWHLMDPYSLAETAVSPITSVLVAVISFSLAAAHHDSLKPQIEPMQCSFFTVKKPRQDGYRVTGDLGPDVYGRLSSRLPPDYITPPAAGDTSDNVADKLTIPGRFHTDPDDILVLVVSDYENNRVDMFVARMKSVEDEIIMKATLNKPQHFDSSTTPPEGHHHHHHRGFLGSLLHHRHHHHKEQHSTAPLVVPTDISEMFSHAGTIARVSATEKARLGSVFKPSEVFFDPAGNLFVAERGNKRIQIFSFDLAIAPTSSLSASLPVTMMCPVWASNPNEIGLGRAAIAVNQKTGKPAAFGLDDWRSILCYDDS